MNKNKIKSYAPVARNELIAAVTAKAQVLGLSATKIEPIESKGDVAIIAGRPFPRSVIGPRSNLESAIKREGFGQLMERIAFTWFNRFTALRYMEIQGFLDHGYRVLSHPKGGAIPEILGHATEVDLIGLDKGKVAELRLGGQKDAELYRMLLIAQCNTLHPALPFLFEMSNDATELLLPDNLLHTDSPIRKLVSEIDEADWSQVEIIGWLYQFYISEKKDAVIGKVVKSEDIPAATQLFTPNWIVKYLVQNTLGRQWLATYPQSGLRAKMEFYIEPAEQTDEVKARLREITPTELNPETITFFDPACGSGHILVEAYDLFKGIYEERGYARRDIPRLILEKNLFGLDIDERAAQLSCFALMMKARADERGLFKSDPQVRPNVLAIQESNGLDGDEIARVLTREKIEKLVDSETQLQQTSSSAPGGKIGKPLLSVAHKPDIDGGGINALLTLFENAKTFGSLIHVPEGIAKFLPFFERLIDPTLGRDLIGIRAAEELRPLVRQAKFLSSLFDHVVANPPFMGNKYLNPLLKDFLKKNFKDFEKDLFSCFMIRNFDFGENSALLGFVSPFVWMFISSYEKLREFLFSRKSILSLVRPSYTAFFESAIVPLVTFVCTNNVEGVLGDYFDLGYLGCGDEQAPRFLESLNTENNPTRFRACKDDFRKIPGSTIAYWVSERIREIFEKGTPLGRIADPRQGMATTDNKLYLRYWFEPSIARIGFGLTNREEALLSRKKWFPYNKGGSFRKWYGNNDYVVDWEKDGERIKSSVIEKYPYLKGNTDFVLKKTNPYFSESITWSAVSSSFFGVRKSDKGFLFDVGGSSAFPKHDWLNLFTGFLCTKIVFELMKAMNPTLNFQVGNVASLPVLEDQIREIRAQVEAVVEELCGISREDWDLFETSWNFQRPGWLTQLPEKSLMFCHQGFLEKCRQNILKMRELETENNRLFIESYGLEMEMRPEVPEEQITLTVNPKYRYGAGLTDDEYLRRFRNDSTKELLSYAVGCMMGRYSLDKPGLIYAHAGNDGFDHSQYKTFPADDDGIVPVSDIDWFTDDATPRLVEFIRIVFGAEHLDENLAWVAASFDPKKGETPVETIRRYFSTHFFKNHMQMYKKRPIYWLFSSGKQKAFEAIVYLHRYNESTLSRMRAQYVTPLQGKLNARIEHLRREIEGAGSASAKTKLRKEVESLTKKQVELVKFDEELRHFADQRIKLDLDEGVKKNYALFGTLLAETKAITGGEED